MNARIAAVPLAFLLTACQPASSQQGALPGDSADRQPFAEIAASEAISFLGTEPFWSGQTSGTSLTYKTPEKEGGETIAVKRFAGRGGLSVTGMLAGASFDLTVTPGECSDGMSDRTYPYTATLKIGETPTRLGCAWTDTKRFTGPETP
jgi:uncharacterized membrane protein